MPERTFADTPTTASLMDNRKMKSMINARIKELNKQWTKEANKSDRERAMDYIKIGNIEGEINGLTYALTLLS